jgi:arylsulfatase A-like enzyme
VGSVSRHRGPDIFFYGKPASSLTHRMKEQDTRRISITCPQTAAGGDVTPDRTPNLVFLLADQLRYQPCGYAGDRRARTPNIDAFARESASFSNAVSGHPVCAPYRASLFTGKYTTSTGMVINELRINPNHECLAHVLARHGYQTAYIGKWHLWANQLGNHHDPKNSYTPPGPHRLGFDGFWAAYNFHHEYYKGYYHTNSPDRIAVPGYEPDYQTRMAIDVVREYAAAHSPFALFLSVGTPHDPWNADNVPADYYAMFEPSPNLPPNYQSENDPYADNWGRFSEPDERAAIGQWARVYNAMTADLDHNFGRLMQAIQKAGVADDTIVVFTSDHGEMHGAHGRRGKNIFYEEAVRVPFLIRWPGRIPAGSVTDACLNAPDIMPTLLSMMQLPIPAKAEGMDLSHCARGNPGPEPEAAFMQGMGAVASWEDGHEWRALRGKRFTYAVYRVDGRELLFDNRSDPYQLCDLARDPAARDVLKHHRALLARRMRELDDTFEASTWYRDHWTKDRVITCAP